MKDLTPAGLKKNARADSASTERTVEYTSDEGTVKERTSVSYKVDKGNAIDNVVNTVAESKSVKKAAGFLNKLIRLAISGFGGFVAGAVSYELGRELFHTYDPNIGRYGRSVWDVPEPLVISGAVIIGLIASVIVYAIYSKLLVKRY